MKNGTETLPDNSSELQNFVASLQENMEKITAQNAQLNAEKSQLESQLNIQDETVTVLERKVDSLESELRLYKIKHYKSQSEKAKTILEETGLKQVDLFPEELQKALEELGIETEDEAEEEKVVTPKPYTRKKRKSRQLSQALPRVEVTYTLDDKSCDHCGKELKVIGEEPPLEQLAIVPAKQFVIRHIRKKYGCSCKQCIKRAEMPNQPIPKSQASPILLAFLMVSKFLDGLPLYRLENILARYGLAPSRQSMARWFIQCSDHLERLVQAFRLQIALYDIAACDETRLQVLQEPGRDPTTQSWLWIQRGGPPDKKVILVDYDPSRAAKVPKKLFQDFKNGYLVSDAYAGYKQVARDNNLTLVGCHDHARRKFKEAYDSLSPAARKTKGGIAKLAIKRYTALYKIERDLANKDPETKKNIRQEKSLPMQEDFKKWLLEVKHQGIAHDKTLTAINYFLNQYDTLIRYCDDGRLPISNIASEHIAKTIAIARKNFLFSNTQSGAYAAANIYSVILTATQHNLEPTQYLTWVLSELPNIKNNQSIDRLMPWNLTREQLKQHVDAMPSI